MFRFVAILPEETVGSEFRKGKGRVICIRQQNGP